MTAPAWERQDGESSRAYAAFLRYRDAGYKRSLGTVFQGQNGGKRAPSQVEAWSSRYNWPARCAAWDSALQRDADALVIFGRSEARRQQLEDLPRALAVMRAGVWGEPLVTDAGEVAVTPLMVRCAESMLAGLGLDKYTEPPAPPPPETPEDRTIRVSIGPSTIVQESGAPGAAGGAMDGTCKGDTNA